jgi:GNAT superfamily N-acetyltransferase
MTENITRGAVPRQVLTDAELAEVRELASVCEAFEHLDLRLGWDSMRTQQGNISSRFLFYRDGIIIGFLSLDGLGFQEAEGSGMVHPEHRRTGVFSALVAAAGDECRRNGTTALLCICDRRSQTGKAFLASIGAQYSFSEHKMELRGPTKPAIQDNNQLDFRTATVEDAPAIARIVAEDEEDDLRRFEQQIVFQIEQQARHYYIASVNGAPFGTINVDVIDGNPYIYGFVILPGYRGHGYGRRMLMRTIELTRDAYRRPIFIEVESENHPALSLYLSCGFEIVNTHDYYRLNLAP